MSENMDYEQNNKQCILVWKIQNFSLGSTIIESTNFETNIFNREEWRLCFCWEISGECSVLIRRVDSGKELKLNYQFKILCENDDNLVSEISEDVFKRKPCFWKDFMILQDILNKREVFLPHDCLTVQCCLWNNYPSAVSISRCVSRTTIEKEVHSFLWNIHSYDENIRQSQTFEFTGNRGFTLNYEVIDDDINLFLTVKSPDCLSLLMSGKIALLDCNGHEKKSVQKQFKMVKYQDIFMFPPFLKEHEISCNKSIFLANDTLSFRCTFSISTCRIINDIASSSSAISHQDFARDLQEMYAGEKLTDVLLVTKSKRFAAHRVVLASKSPVFLAMFEGNMIESRNGTINIEDIDDHTLDTMLKFMYGLPVKDLNFEQIKNLFVVADKYQIYALKSHCRSLLRSSLSRENVCQAFVFADIFEDNTLKTYVTKYFMSHSAAILRSSEWRDFMENHCNLSNSILYKLSLEKCE